MLSGQFPPSTALQQHSSETALAINGSLKDEPQLIAFANALDPTATTTRINTMTKQLTTNSATTISNGSLAPTGGGLSGGISPLTSPASTATSPHAGGGSSVCSTRKGATAGFAAPATPISALPTKCVPTTASSQTATATMTTTTTTTTATSAAAAAAAADASGRSAALERAYVHDVYEHCEEPTGPIRPRVAQFLSNLDAGSVVCDVGCGSGRYLTQCNPAICTIGVDRCYRLSKVAHEKGGEVALCDNLELPFRDESFDAVLSLAVVHHFATTERRVSALRELARILRIGGRVVITVWALEQRHRRFESQDVLIPWQPPKNRNLSYSDEEDDDSFLPPYHAYTEDSTNSSRSAGDGDSSSLSSSSPGESCYSFVRRAIQKLAGGRKHPWFLDSWTSKDTRNDSSLDYEDAKDLPIELRRLEDFEDFPDPPLSAGLKSRSLGSILNPPPRQIVRSRSSVPSLGGALLHMEPPNVKTTTNQQNAQFLSALDSHNGAGPASAANGHSPPGLALGAAVTGAGSLSGASGAGASASASLGRRPKLIKQKQSLCDEDYQLPENPFHMISSYNSCSNSVSSSLYLRSGCYYSSSTSAANHHHHPVPLTTRQMMQASIFLRKQSSLNEELMAGNRIREKERVRKRIQKQMSLNEAFLCRSALFSKRLQVIREGFASKIKSSTGSLERATKNSLTKIMHNFKAHAASGSDAESEAAVAAAAEATDQNGGTQEEQQSQKCPKHQHYHHHHHHHHQQQQHHFYQQQQPHHAHYHQNHAFGAATALHKQLSLSSSSGGGGGGVNSKFAGPVTYCNSADCSSSTACYCSTYHHVGCSGCCATDIDCQDAKDRRHSRESGSDSSKDSSLQSDTSIESEDSFASVIFIPKPEQHQQQLNYQQQHQNSNSSSSNSSSSNGGSGAASSAAAGCQHKCNSCVAHLSGHHHYQQLQQHPPQTRLPSLPTSPLIMPCPPTPAHSPAAAQIAITSPPQTMAAVTAAMAILTPPGKAAAEIEGTDDEMQQRPEVATSRFNFDEAHIKRHESQQQQQNQKQQEQKQQQLLPPPASSTLTSTTAAIAIANSKITRQSIRDLPPIPKFRKQQSLQLHRQSFPIVRRSSATTSSAATVTIPNIPKLLSLELFNPATDDLDSDSSEASSPDSIDSVISTAKSAATTETAATTTAAATTTITHTVSLKQQQYHNGDLKINPPAPHDIILNDASCNLLPAHSDDRLATTKQPQNCAEFAEQLSAQLLREIEDKHNHVECRSLDSIGGDIGDYLEDSGSGLKKRNGELRDLSALREELRERRLMLANLSTQPSLQQSPTSSSSSLSSQTRSFTIHEENEEENDERSYTLQLYENCKISKFNYKRNRHYNLNPETAYLLQDDGDIFEEDEEAEALEAEQDKQLAPERKTSRNTIKCDSWEEEEAPEMEGDIDEKRQNRHAARKAHQQHQHRRHGEHAHSLQNRQSTESWGNSNSSTNSLDSPSQGGATTHHRYYHVFREGELDALINHHVASLHIVSSYYERASWCVVAEKVQVWTI